MSSTHRPLTSRLRQIRSKSISRSQSQRRGLRVLTELRRLNASERRAVLNRLIELEADAHSNILDDLTQSADESFQMLDAMENDDAANQSR